MRILHDAKSGEYRRPCGAAEISSPLFLACEAPGAESVVLCLRTDAESWERETERAGDRFFLTFPAPAEPCVLWYAFRCGDDKTEERQITVYRRAAVPAWYKDAVVYQIFPDRFARERGWTPRQPEKRRGTHRFLVPDWETPPFYPRDEKDAVSAWPFWGGTLRGIKEKLPYLRSLGVTCLYLNPIFAAASNHRYDTADYFRVDPLLGTEADFVSLCRAGREQGVRVLLDGVFSHTGADSVYFDKFGNYGTGDAYRKWYRFGEQYTHGYECWWDVPDLPNVEELEGSYLEFICGEDGVIRHWMRLGAAGWRLDVADELPDECIREVRRAVKAEDPDGVLLGEVWEDASNKISYGERRAYFSGEELDATMHYPFREIALDFLLGRASAPEAAERLETLREHYPPENYYAALNLIGSHDRPRALTLLEGDRERMKLLSALQFLLPGVPCIYYGDEAGMTGGADPYNRGAFPWGGEDEELLAHYRSLAALYAAHPALKGGSCRFFARGDDVLCCVREDERESLTVQADRASCRWSVE